MAYLIFFREYSNSIAEMDYTRIIGTAL